MVPEARHVRSAGRNHVPPSARPRRFRRRPQQLLPLVYEELRRLAQIAFQRESSGHTLRPTALVHEAFLRLFKGSPSEFADRSHFLGIASRIMRQVLVDHARARRAQKRGAQFTVQLNEQIPSISTPGDLLEIDSALDKLNQEILVWSL